MSDNTSKPDATLESRQEQAGFNIDFRTTTKNPEYESQEKFQDQLIERDAVKGLDIEQYAPYTGYITHLSQRDATAARNQSSAEKYANGLYRGLYGEVLGGALMGFGALAMKVTDEKNFLFELGNAISENATADTPIYKHTDDTFAFNDAGWWASNFGNILSAVSMLVPATAVAKGAAFAGRGIAAVGKAGRVLKAGKAVNKGADAAGIAMREAGRAAMIEKKSAQVAGALAMRHAENIREGVDVLAEAEEAFMQDGRSLEEFQDTLAWNAFVKANNDKAPRNKEELARFVGGQAAVRSYQVNSANIVFDFMQMGTVLRGVKTVTRGKGITGAAARKAGKAATGIDQGTRLSRFADIIKPTAMFLAESAGEGVEEAINFIGNAEGAAYGEELRELEIGSVGERLGGYLRDDHLYESAFWGFLGGGLFQGAAAVIGPKQNIALQSMERTQERIVKQSNAIKVAEEKGDRETAERLRKEMLNDMGTRAAQSGRVDQLLEQLNSDEFMKQLQENGMLGDKSIQEARQELVEGVLKQEGRYKKAKKLQQEYDLTNQEMHVLLQQMSQYETALEGIGSQLEELDNDSVTPEQKLATQFVLRDYLSEESKKLKKGETAVFAEELQELEKELKGKERPKNLDKLMSREAVLSTRLGLEQKMYKRKLSELTTPTSLGNLREKVETYNTAQDKKIREVAKASIAKETDVVKLEQQLKGAQKNNETELADLIKERITVLKETDKKQKDNEDDIDENPEGGEVIPDEEVIPEEEKPTNETDDLEKLNMKALRVIAKQEGVKGYSRMKKADLIQAIRDAREKPDLFTPQDEDDVPETLQQKRARRKTEAIENATTPIELLNAIEDLLQHQRASDERSISSELDPDVIERAEFVKAQLQNEGYTVTELIGRQYDVGMLVEADFVFAEDRGIDLKEGKPVIIRINQPEVRKDGKLIQAAKIVVAIPSPPVEPDAETESVTAPQGQIKMVMNDLMEAFLGKFRAGSSVTVPGSRNVEHVLIDEAFLELDAEQSLQYQALMFVLSNPEAPITIRISDVLRDNPQPNPLASVTVSGKAKGIKVLKKTEQGRGKGIEYSNEEDLSPDYELVTSFNGQEVVLGYVPRVGTLLEQAARLQLQWAAAQQNAVPNYQGDKGDTSTYWKDSYANANLNALQAIQHADAIAQLREYLDSQSSGQVQLKGLATRKAFDGSPRRGSLLRPAVGNMLTLESSPAVVDAVKEFGICIMLHNKDKGAFLYNLKTQSSEALPYQDGVMGMDGQYSLRKNNNSSAMGAIFIPIPDPNHRAGGVMWVRMPDMSLKDAGLVDLVQNILVSEENYTPEKRLELLGQYMSVTPMKVTLEKQVKDNFTGAAYVKSTPGATRTLRLYKDGKVILQYGEDNKPVNNRVVSAEVLGDFKFRIGHEQGESGQSQANYQKDINDLKTGISVPRLEDAIIQNGKLPVAPVVNELGEVLGYHHPVPALRIPPSESDKGSGKQNQQYNPETQSTQLPIAIDMAQLLAQQPDDTSVVKEEGKEGSKKGTENTDTSNDTSAFGGAAFMSVERAMVSDLNKQASTEDQKAAQEWMAENLPHVPFRRVKGLITRGGVTAYGIWEQGMVKVSDIAVVGTEFHEAFHAVMDTYLSDSRKDKILAEAKAKYGDLGPVELEERLAEAFREYVLTEGLSMKEKSAIRRFFAELAALVKAMFQGQYRTRQLMQHINQGKYAYKPSARSTGFLTKFSKVPAFTVMELKELEQLMPLMISGIYSSLQPALQSDDPGAVLNKAYPKAEDQAIRDALIEIASEIKELSTPEPEEAFSGTEEGQEEVEDQGPTPRERKVAISKLLMEAIFNERGYIQLMMNMSQSESDMVQSMRERLKSQKDVLINHFATNPQAQRLVMQGLNVNEVTGTTAAEQYGGTDMAEINPMDKVPASIKNMIAKTVYIPAAHSAKIIEAVSAKSEAKEKILEEAQALQTKGSTGYANLHDQHSHFGLPRFLRFETVYPYLLHHLSTLPSYEAMEAKMIELSKYNPSLAMIVLKMNNDPGLKAQFYVGMKRANSQELIINLEKKDVGMGRMELVVTRRSNQIKSPVDILTYNNLEVVQDTLKRMSVADRTQTASVLDNAIKAGDVPTSMLRKVLNKIRFTSVDPAARDNTLDLLTAEERILLGDALRELFKADSKASSTILFKKVQLVSQRTNLHLADMGAIQSMFASGVKSKYAHMNPCYLSELFDALNHTQSDTNTQLQDKLNDNPHLLNSLWHTMLTKGDGLKYRRYGTFKGVAYADMSMAERMEYDILAVLNMQGGEFQSGYSPIPTPSDADGTYMVQNDFLTYGQPVQDEILAAIYDAERRVRHKSLPIEVLSNPTKEAKAAHIRTLLEAEAEALLKVPEAKAVISRLSSKHLGKMPAQEVATNYVMATYVSNWNTSNWVGGTIDHFKGDITKYQKRFKHVQSPGQTSADTGTFKNVTIADPQTTESWATRVQYKDGQPVIKDGKYVLENAPIDRADAQSYVTLDFFERMLESHGEMTEYKKAVFEKARNSEALTVNERSVFAPYKPFYFGWIGGQPHQIKNSVIPLLPPVKGTAPISVELDNMRKWMEDPSNKIDQITLASAHKVGAQEPTVLFEDGKFVKPKGEYISYDMPMSHHRNQVAMVEHAKHSGTVNLGNQTSRIITGGLREYEGLGQEMIDKLSKAEEKLYNIKLKELKAKLFREVPNETSVLDRNQVVIAKLREYVLGNLRDDVHPAVVEMLQSTDYSARNAPMIAFVLDAALKAAVQADYKGQRVAGGQQVQISDLGHINPKTGEALQGMRVVDGKVLPAEVKMNRKFLPAHLRDKSIEEIEKIDPTYLEVMVYRVPAEGKNSMAMCKVVEFLPAGQDGVVIPAAFVAQMGSDFDIDKLFVNWQKRARPGKMLNRYDSTANEYFRLQKEVLMHPEVVKNEVLQPQGFETIKAFRTENMKTRMMGETNIVNHMTMYPYGVMAHLQMHQDNMAGVGLKAMAADNNSFWLQMQRYGIELEGINMADIPLDIIKWNAEAVAASMDGAKDPVWGTMGINKLNFNFFMYECTMGYMRELKMGIITTEQQKQSALRRARRTALLVATDPAVLYLLENFDAPIDSETASENEKLFGNYKAQIIKSGEVYGLRRAVNVSKMKMRELEKLVDIPGSVRDALTDDETNDASRAIEVLEKPVIQGALSITNAAKAGMGGLGIYFYDNDARALNTDFGTYTATQTTTMADEHVSLSKNLDAILGTRGTDGKLRDIDLLDVSTWNIPQWLTYFQTTAEGQAIVAENPDLQRMLLHISHDGSYEVAGKRYDRITPLQLSDPMNVLEFQNAWNSLYNPPDQYEGEVHYPSKFAQALVTYEAARSGWRKSPRFNFSGHLPTEIVRSTAINNYVAADAIAAYKVLDPRINTVTNLDDALLRPYTVKYKGEIYINVPGLDTNHPGKTVRTKVKAPNTTIGFRGTQPLVDIAAQLQDNLEEVQTAITERKEELSGKKNQSRKAMGGPAANTSERIAHLQSRFASYGVKVRVVLDSTIDAAGEVEYSASEGVVRIHPDRLKSDTIVHEFAHIYVEMLGFEHPAVQAVITELRDTPLWREISELYPDLSARDLAMEVVVTAMGIEGDAIFEQAKNPNKLKTLINKLLRALGKLIGIQPNTARELVRDMIGGTNPKVSKLGSFRAQQRLNKNLEAGALLQEVSDELLSRVDHMRRLGATTTEQQDLMDRISRDAHAFRAVAEKNDVAALDTLNIRMVDYIKDATVFIEEATVFIESSQVGNLTEADINMMNKAYQLMQVLTTFKQAFDSYQSKLGGDKYVQVNQAFRELQPRVQVVQNNLDNMIKKMLSKKLIQNSTNPKLKEAMEAAADIFSLSQTEFGDLVTDTSQAEVQFLGILEQDSNPVLTLFGKTIRNVINTEEMNAKNDIAEMQSILDKFEAEGGQISDLLEPDGKSFISAVRSSFWTNEAKSSDRRRWRAKNMVMEYVPEYYLKYKYVPDNKELQQLKNEIVKYQERDALGLLTADDKNKLGEMQEAATAAEQNKKSFRKYHDPTFDMESFERDYAEAKADPDPTTLLIFESNFVHESGEPRFGTKYHTGSKVKEKYKNPEWKGTDVPLKKWLNPKADALSPLQVEAIEGLKGVMQKAYGNPEARMFTQSLIPQIEKPVAQSLTETLRNMPRKAVALNEDKARMSTDSNGRKIFMRGGLKHSYRSEGPVSTDLRLTMAQFIVEARAQQASNNIETFSLMTRDQLSDMDLTARKGWKLQFKDGESIGKKQGNRSTIRGERSNSMDMMEHVLEGYLGEGWQTTGKYDKQAAWLQSFTSWQGLAINPSAWINNFMYGELQQILDSVGGDMYTSENLKKAGGVVFSHVMDLAKSRDKGVNPESKTAALLNFFDATMDQRELPEGAELRSKFFDMMYIGQSLGEVVMQSQVVLAMMYETQVRFKDGTTGNLYDAVKWEAGMGRNVKLVEGAVVLRKDGTEVPLDMAYMGSFKTKSVAVLQRIHGAYNSEDLGRFHRKAIGRLVLQFRKWMPQALKKRFGADRYSEAREQAEVGYYRALWMKVIIPSILGSESDKKMRFLAQYNSQDPHVQLAVKRALVEISMGVTAALLSYVFAALIEVDGDDDEEFFLLNDEYYKAKLLFHAARLSQELNSYTPWGMYDTALRIGQDPTAALRQFKTFSKLLYQVGLGIAPGVELERFKGGHNYGDLKITKYASDIAAKQLSREMNAITNHQIYKLS